MHHHLVKGKLTLINVVAVQQILSLFVIEQFFVVSEEN